MTVPQTSTPDDPPLKVTHYHFTAWPDHGVPADKTSLIQFIQRTRKCHPYSNTDPLLVHCSAGVGRTGTFMLLDSMLQRMKSEETLDIYDFLVEMRARRPLMVQTEVGLKLPNYNHASHYQQVYSTIIGWAHALL